MLASFASNTSHKPVKAGSLLRTEQLEDHIAILPQLLGKLVNIMDHKSLQWVQTPQRTEACRAAGKTFELLLQKDSF